MDPNNSDTDPDLGFEVSLKRLFTNYSNLIVDSVESVEFYFGLPATESVMENSYKNSIFVICTCM